MSLSSFTGSTLDQEPQPLPCLQTHSNIGIHLIAQLAECTRVVAHLISRPGRVVDFSALTTNMAAPSQSPVRLAFGPFELNAAAEEVLKNGVRVRLSGQPFRILLTLLAQPGNVITREYLRDCIWGDGTFVDFEHGLDAAVNKLRRALDDSAENPRYIETVPGRGYRFIGTVERRLPPPAASVTGGKPSLADSRVALHTAETTLERLRIRSPLTAWISVAAVGTAFGIWGAITLLTTRLGSVPRPVVQFEISPPPGTIFAAPISRQPFAISPDGTRLAFTATGPNGTNVWIRELGSLDLRTVPGTEGAWALFWSLDSRSVFYSVKRTLKEANLETASSRSVANLPFNIMFGAWRSKGDLVLYSGDHTFYELFVENGAVRHLPGEHMRWPEFLTRDHFLHVVFDPALNRYRAMATDYASQKSVPLMETDSRVQFAPPRRSGELGHLLFMRGSGLLAQAFDANRLRLAGEPFPIVQNVIYFRPSASACFSVSENGVLVYQTGIPLSELNWYDRTGREVGIAGKPLPYVGPLRLSPDGRQVAAGVWSPDTGGIDIWIFEANGRQSRRLTFPPAVHSRPVWSADGKRLLFSSTRAGPPELAALEMAEGGKEQAVAAASRTPAQIESMIQMPTDWSKDGRFVAFDTGLGEEEQEVWLADLAGGKMMPLLHNEFAQYGGAFSPDGKRIAFVSNQSGRPEVYVQAFDLLLSPQLIGERRQLSRDGAWLVRWRPDGRELFYVGLDNWLHAVAVEEPLQFGEPKALFRIAGTPQYGTTSDFQFDVTMDGQRFIMTTTGSVAPPRYTVIENWQDKFHR